MDPFEFTQLRIVFGDLCTGFDCWDTSGIKASTKERWTTLHTSLKSGSWRTEDEIIGVSLSDLLHKLMLIACAQRGARDIGTSCPGRPFVIMEIDTQIAKKKRRQKAEARRTDDDIEFTPKKKETWWTPMRK
jgi:hypothetical protein